jgi:hypothetical protein
MSFGSTEEHRGVDGQIRKGSGSERFAPADAAELGVGSRGWLSINFDEALGKVDDPDLGDAGPGVEGQLLVAINEERGVGNFDEQEDIRWCWVGVAIEIGPRLQQHEIGLRFVVFTEMQRILYAGDPTLVGGILKEDDEPFDGTAVEGTDGHHMNNLSVEQFDAFVLVQHADFGKPVVFIDGKLAHRRGYHAARMLMGDANGK